MASMTMELCKRYLDAEAILVEALKACDDDQEMSEFMGIHVMGQTSAALAVIRNVISTSGVWPPPYDPKEVTP